MRIGIMGGTFNPPHKGHINAARAARKELSLSRLILIPSSTPPHKQMADASATPEQRLCMTRLMAEELSCEVSDTEILRGGTSYTVDTLRELCAKNPTDELWFIMGTDMFLTLEKWREPEEIMRLANIAVVPRNEADRERLMQHAEYLEEKYGAGARIMKTEALEISSTEIRDAIRNGNPSEYLPDAVFEYIKQNNLYI
ncbi:MAG: nicotinate-nucleotide adenylyltransferase [Oscillospiraceae bacterium]|nr:nicotinate-nucleotide adenylyltransferase [Oscillospiraceae bacterium]